MSQPDLIGRCGLYCGACMIYGVSHRDEPVFAEKRRGIAEYFDCDIAEIICEGCGALGEKCWSNNCPLVLCLNEKGYKYCDECSDIDVCEKFGDINSRYSGLKVSMARLREVGDEQWLAEKRVERTCSECGGVIYYYDEEVCVKCVSNKKSK